MCAALSIALSAVQTVRAQTTKTASAAGTTLADTSRKDSLADSATPAVAVAAPVDVEPLLTPDTAAAAAMLEVAESAPPESTVIEAPPATAPLFVGSRELLRIVSSRDGLTPLERASAIRKRFNRAVADRTVPTDSLRLVSSPDGIEMRLGKYFLMVITPGDVPDKDPHELGVWLTLIAENAADSIDRERSGRTPLRLLISAGLALLFTLIAIALFKLLHLMSQRWRKWLTNVLGERLPAIRFRNFEVLSRAQIAGVVVGVLSRLDVVVGLLLLYAYLTSVFWLFPWTQGWAWLLLNFATTNILEIIRSLGTAVPGLMIIAIIMMLFRWLVQLSDRIFDAVGNGTLVFSGFHPELARPSKRLLRILLWIIAVMIAYPYIPGGQSKAVQGVSILLGLMVSIGSTGVVGNMLAGLVLTYSRSFTPGDRVKVADQIGDVVSLGFFSTKLRTIRNEEVTIPNGQVAATAITNYTRLCDGPGLILHAEITIGYDVEWRKVHELMIEAAKSVEGIETDPEPWVFQTALNDYYVAYEINAITRLSHPQRRLYSDLYAAIQDSFNKGGVEILSPAYSALRDGNAIAMPAEPKGPRPEPPAFRVKRPEA
jgi:small-conductance mechanosensitive channel